MKRFFFGKLYIVKQNVDAIFGREWMKELNVGISELKQVGPTVRKLDKLIEKYKDIFDKKIGRIPNIKGSYRLVEMAKPIYCKPRPVPYALKEGIEKELDRLEKEGIIVKVDYSEWGTPLVPVVKPNGTIRLCADYKVTLNRVIKDEPFPIPRIEDIYASMAEGKYFCTLDVSNAYLHLEMDDESADMQTLSTHRGLYKVLRLMFGVKTAPQIWNRFMERILQGLSGVHFFF